MRLTENQRTFLQFAASAPSKGWDGVSPRRGQHAMIGTLLQRGLLRGVGMGRHVDTGRDVELYAITEAGQRALSQ